MSEAPLLEARNILKKRLCGHTLPTHCRPDINSAFHELSKVLKRTVDFGESNSVLLVGMKGSGKSLVIRKALEYIKAAEKNYMVVQLNGYMQTNDRIALEEITRQLKLENTLGDKVFGSFSETLSFLLQALQSGNTSKSLPILFILEEFDLFAQHKNQTLLYNLFDIAQAGTTPMAVVGVTSRMDVMELLEKRVKSRFSHRKIFICNSWNFNDFVSGLVDSLKLSHENHKGMPKWRSFVTKWNASVVELSKNRSVLDTLTKLFNLNKEITGIQRLLILPVSKLNSNHPFLTPTDIADSAKWMFMDSRSNILHGVSVLELCLVIAMYHLTNIYEGEPFNFQMVYNEFLKFSHKNSLVLQNPTKPVVLKAYENLIELELLKTKDNQSNTVSKVQKEYRPMILLVNHSQLKDAVSKYPDCPTDVKNWAESSIL